MNKNSKWMKRFSIKTVKFDKSLQDYRAVKKLRRKKP
jgi:hypothetical protein